MIRTLMALVAVGGLMLSAALARSPSSTTGARDMSLARGAGPMSPPPAPSR